MQRIPPKFHRPTTHSRPNLHRATPHSTRNIWQAEEPYRVTCSLSDRQHRRKLGILRPLHHQSWSAVLMWHHFRRASQPLGRISHTNMYIFQWWFIFFVLFCCSSIFGFKLARCVNKSCFCFELEYCSNRILSLLVAKNFAEMFGGERNW